MKCQCLCTTRGSHHLQLWHNSNSFKEDGKGPKYFKQRIFVWEDKGTYCSTSYQISSRENIILSIVCCSIWLPYVIDNCKCRNQEKYLFNDKVLAQFIMFESVCFVLFCLSMVSMHATGHTFMIVL
jgi:hypothetical protein